MKILRNKNLKLFLKHVYSCMSRVVVIFAILFPFLIMAQKMTVNGRVSHSGDVLMGVNILEKGTANGTTTDFNGNYTIKVDQNAVLIFSYIGFVSQEIPVETQSQLDITLEEDLSYLDEVEVRGFTNILGRARKRLESIQDVPESISVATATDIEITGVEDLGGFLTQIPGISYGESQDPGTVIISVRGIPQIRYGPSPIATVVDGVYLASADLNNQALFDIEQIEVVKGSQGLFFGKNAIGGAVVITTKQPSNGISGKIKTGYGNGNTATVQANIGGSITDDKSYYRLGISFVDSDGFIENTTLNENVDFRSDLGLRGQLKFRLGGSSTLSFSGQYGKNQGGAITFVSSALNDDFPKMSPNVYKGSPNGDFLGEGTLESVIGSISLETNFNGFRLTSHTSYSDVSLHYDGDYLSFAPLDNYGPIPAIFQEMLRASRTFNEELRLVSSNSQSKLKWNLGLFYQNINSDWDTSAHVNQDTSDKSYTNTIESKISNDDNTLSSIGLFGFFEYNITNALNFSAGLRNEWETVKNIEGVTGVSSERSYSAFQPKISVSYKLSTNNMLYTSYSKGFRSGGYNPAEIPASGLRKIIEPEFANSYEAGLKNSFWDNRFILNLAYFYTIFENQQVYRFGLDASGRSILGTVNFEESKINGFEIDTKLRLSKNFDITGGFSVINSEITKAFEDSAIGNKVPFAPQSSYNLGVFSQFDTGKNSKLIAKIDIQNKGKKYWFADDLYGVDQEKVFQNPFTLINAKAMIELNTISVGIFGRNIFNTKYNEEWWPLGVFGDAIGDIRTPNRPTTYGLEFSYKF